LPDSFELNTLKIPIKPPEKKEKDRADAPEDKNATYSLQNQGATSKNSEIFP